MNMTGPSIRPAFSVPTSHDLSGYLWITTVLGVIYTILVALVRVYIKFQVLGVDDYLLGLATVLHLAQAVPVFLGLANGLAESTTNLSASNLSRAGEAFLAAEALAILALSLAKCSVSAIVIRVLTLQYERRWYICWGFLAINAIWGLTSVAGLVIHCNASNLLAVNSSDYCPGQLLRWMVITSVDIALETASFLLSLFLVWDLNMSLKLKAQVILAFIFRLPLLVLSIYHFRKIAEYVESGQPRLTVTGNMLLLQGMLTWSVISATVPNLRGFLKSFTTRFGMPAAYKNRTLKDTYPLVTIGGNSTTKGQGRTRALKNSRVRPDGFESDEEPTFRPDIAQSTTTISHADTGSQMIEAEQAYVNGNGSQELIITKEVQWDVHYNSPKS